MIWGLNFYRGYHGIKISNLISESVCVGGGGRYKKWLEHTPLNH